MAENLDPKMTEEDLRHSPAGYPRSRLAGAGPFENVAGICVIVFERSGQIRMSGTGPRDATFRSGVTQDLAGGHDFFPIGPVPVLDHHCDWTADALTVPHT